MGQIARLLLDSDARLRQRLAPKMGAVAAAIRAQLPAVLGTPGPAPSRPGEAPRRQSGRLLAGTRAVVNPDNSVSILSTAVGAMLDTGTRRMASRPWVKRVLDGSAAARRAAIFGR